MTQTIRNATREQIEENTKGKLYTVKPNASGGLDLDQYCTIEDVERYKRRIRELEKKVR